MPDLVEWLETAISERERVAWAACNPGAPAPAAPESWRWVDNDSDRPVDPGFDGELSLRSVQEYPLKSVSGTLPHIVISYAHGGVSVEVARFLQMGDPAAVLRRCAADRKILAKCVMWIDDGSGITSGAVLGRVVLRALAEGYGYQEADHG